MVRKKILVVDDEPANRKIFERLLSSEYCVVLVENGEEGLDILKSFLPDLIILDVQLPGIDGYKVCQKIREEETFNNIKIVIISSKAIVSEQSEAYKSGADSFISKPFDFEDFLSKINLSLSS